MLARARRELVADAVAHPDRAGLAVLRGRLGADLLRHHARAVSASILLYSVGSEVLSVVLLKLWANGQAEQVSVIGLMMMLLVIFFRWVQLTVRSSDASARCERARRLKTV